MENTDKIKSFLKSCKKKLSSSELTLCMGNEACDTDSFVSSLVTAIHEKAVFVINMSRKIVEFKGDIVYLCKYIGITLDDLIFIEKPAGTFSHRARKLGTFLKAGNEEFYLNGKNVSLILVDHHRPIIELDDRPIELIIDHHMLSAPSLISKRVYVDIDIGSCATLVSKFVGHSLFKKKYNKHSDFESKTFCSNIARLLTIPIILDTHNFTKVTSHFDKGEFKRLKKLANIKKKEVVKVANDLRKARKDDKNLDNEIILRKDMKRFEYHGFVFTVSTIKYKFEKWVDREAKKAGKENSKDGGQILEMYLHQFRKENGCDFVCVNKKEGEKRYFAMVCCPFERILVEKNNFIPLNYKTFSYYEIDVRLSRKLLIPKIKEIIDHLNLDSHHNKGN